jgi:hypothetical protein
VATRRLILATTELFAAGGVQQVSRQAVRALSALPSTRLEAWSLMDRSIPAGADCPSGVRLRLAGGD